MLATCLLRACCVLAACFLPDFSLGLAIDSQISGCAWNDKVICDGEVVKVMVELVAQHDL